METILWSWKLLAPKTTLIIGFDFCAINNRGGMFCRIIPCISWHIFQVRLCGVPDKPASEANTLVPLQGADLGGVLSQKARHSRCPLRSKNGLVCLDKEGSPTYSGVRKCYFVLVQIYIYTSYISITEN